MIEKERESHQRCRKMVVLFFLVAFFVGTGSFVFAETKEAIAELQTRYDERCVQLEREDIGECRGLKKTIDAAIANGLKGSSGQVAEKKQVPTAPLVKSESDPKALSEYTKLVEDKAEQTKITKAETDKTNGLIQNTANESLLEAKRKQNELDKIASQMSPPRLQQHQDDIQLVRSAEEANRRNRYFPKEAAELAADEDIRRNLIVFSAAQESRRELLAESSRLAAQLAELGRVALLAGNRSSSMKSVPQSDNAIVSNSRGVTTAELASLASREEDVQITEIENKLKAPGLSEKEKKLLQAKLKDRLRKKLADRGKKDAAAKKAEALAAAGTHFDGKLGAETVDSSKLKNSLISEAGIGALDAVLKTANSSGNAFSLAGAETDASVRQIMDDAERDLASSSDGGILTSNSASLFERVRSAYRNCLTRECVRLN